MSIALAVIIAPSRTLRRLLWGFALLQLGAALLLAGGEGVAGARFVAAPWLACASSAAALLAACAARRHGRPEMRRRIDISGLGELRLTVQHSLGPAGSQACRMRLMPGSTLWPQCLLLRLRPVRGGAQCVLVILPDSMAPDQFRGLAVALKAVAGRDHHVFGKNKIL